MIIALNKLLLATATFVAVCFVNCTNNNNENHSVTPAPKPLKCSVAEGYTVSVDFAEIDISYSSPIAIVDETMITLSDNDGSEIQLSATANNLRLNVVIQAQLKYEEVYTLRVAKGAIAAKSDNKAQCEPFTISFKSEVEPFTPNPDGVFEITESLITPNASREAIALYDYLRNGFGKQTLSGAMCKYTVQTTEAEWMASKSGKYPAIICYDFMNSTRDYSWDDPYSTLITSAQEWHDNGGIISAMWHWRDPLRTTDAFYSMNTSYDERTSFDISKISDTSSKEYTAAVADIDVVASYLLELQERNIAVLWRPLHEAQGGWFWWGAGSADDCKALWALLYDRLVEHHKLRNLIWVWTVDKRDGAEKWYPGDDMVDILGTDIYSTPTHDSRRDYFDFVATIGSHTKLVALSECGAIPHPDKMAEGGDIWSWFMPWVGDYTQSDEFNGATFLKTILNSELVITRDEVEL